MDVFDGSVPDVAYDPAALKAQLRAWMKHTMKLPRKPSVGYAGEVIPLTALPLIIGLGADGQYKLADAREIFDEAPDIVWHEWVKLYGSELAPGEPSRQSPGRGGLPVGEVVDFLTGARGGGGALLLDLLRKVLKR